MAKEWTQDLAVGVQEIDTQHKALFEHLAGLASAMSQGQAAGEIGGIIDFLGRYVLSHFATEERYMTSYGYPGYTAHRLQHQAFVREFGEWKTKFQAQGASVTLVLEVHRKVIDWLCNHITKTDKMLGAFLKAQTASTKAAV